MTHLTSETQLEEKSPSLSIGQRCKQMFARFLKPAAVTQADTANEQPFRLPVLDLIAETEPTILLTEPESTESEPVGGLSPELPISMSRIQGALGSQWNAAKGLFIRINQQRVSSWASAPSRPAALIQEKAPSQPARLNHGSNNKEEEVRGLDDLFPKQITDFFMEGSDSKPSAGNGMTTPAQEAKRSKEVIRFEDSLIRKVRWPDCRKRISKTVQETTSDSVEQCEDVVPVSETETAATTMVFENGVASTEEIQLPVADQVESLCQVEDLALEAAVEPEALHCVEMAAAASAFVPDWFVKTTEAVTTTFTTGKAARSSSQKEPAKRLSVREQMAQEQAQEVDLSSLDYMARNNRILGDSISSLVDRYFQQAAMEESMKAY